MSQTLKTEGWSIIHEYLQNIREENINALIIKEDEVARRAIVGVDLVYAQIDNIRQAAIIDKKREGI